MTVFASVDASQVLFRRLLSAMSHPGRCYLIDTNDGPASAHQLLREIAVCLLDHEVGYSVVGSGADELSQDIARLTGSNETDLDQADFLFVVGNSSDGRIYQAKRGTMAYPDLGATVVYSLAEDAALQPVPDVSPIVSLSGPGIDSPRAPQLDGLTGEEYRLLVDINAEYPLGIDVIVISQDGRIMAIPRSTRISVR